MSEPWRKAKEEDYPFVLEGSREFEVFGPYREIISNWLKDPWVETWIYNNRKGFLLLGPFFPLFFRSQIDIMAIYVAPSWRRKGIGGKMLHFAEQRARAKGYRFLRAHVGCGNFPALRLFQKASFKIKKRIEGYYPSGLAAFEFLKDLRKTEKDGP